MATAQIMVEVADARQRAARHFDAHWREWASVLLLKRLGRKDGGVAPAPRLSVALHPPTERQAIEAGKRASAWVADWRDAPVARFALWARREWPRVGAQEVPERVVLEGAEAIATFAGRLRTWRLADRRMEDLAACLRGCWSARVEECDAAELEAAVKRSLGALMDLDEADWTVALRVLEWLAAHQGEFVYARQLPIRGIDTKWIEGHRSAIEPIHRVLAGAPLPFMKPPEQMRVRYLDEELAPCGLRDVSVLPSEFASFPRRPEVVIVSENLVAALALPDMPRALAVHGGGYAATALSQVAWLAETRVLYWGDLDFDGFAILNGVRSHLPHVESVLMDRRCLDAHRDLCVPDPNPRRIAMLERLTDEERATLEALMSSEPALRLEQERVEWGFALEALLASIEEPGDVRSR